MEADRHLRKDTRLRNTHTWCIILLYHGPIQRYESSLDHMLVEVHTLNHRVCWRGLNVADIHNPS